jgi:hypothetical protein
MTIDELKLHEVFFMIETRPQHIQDLAARLRTYYGDERSMQVFPPLGMYPDEQLEFVELEGMASFLANEGLILALFTGVRCKLLLFLLLQIHS